VAVAAVVGEAVTVGVLLAVGVPVGVGVAAGAVGGGVGTTSAVTVAATTVPTTSRAVTVASIACCVVPPLSVGAGDGVVVARGGGAVVRCAGPDVPGAAGAAGPLVPGAAGALGPPVPGGRDCASAGDASPSPSASAASGSRRASLAVDWTRVASENRPPGRGVE
jgi:hypothetical protein